MKKNYLFLLLLLSLSFTLISCSTSNSKNDSNLNNTEMSISEEKEETKEDIKELIQPTTFQAFGKTYASSKDLSLIKVGSNIYDDQKSIFYTPGEYKETDFINDLLYSYLNEDSSVYDYLVSYDNTADKGYTKITEKDKEKLVKDLNSLRSQMELSTGEEMIVRLDRVTYEGVNSKVNSGLTFKIRVAISRVGATIVPWNYFTITVFEEGNKLLAHLF